MYPIGHDLWSMWTHLLQERFASNSNLPTCIMGQDFDLASHTTCVVYVKSLLSLKSTENDRFLRSSSQQFYSLSEFLLGIC